MEAWQVTPLNKILSAAKLLHITNVLFFSGKTYFPVRLECLGGASVLS